MFQPPPSLRSCVLRWIDDVSRLGQSSPMQDKVVVEQAFIIVSIQSLLCHAVLIPKVVRRS